MLSVFHGGVTKDTMICFTEDLKNYFSFLDQKNICFLIKSSSNDCVISSFYGNQPTRK